MKKIMNPTLLILTINISCLIFVVLFTSVSFADGIKNGTKHRNVIVTANVLTLGANMNFHQMSISYNGLSKDGEVFFPTEMNTYSFGYSKFFDADYDNLGSDDEMFQMDRMLERMTLYLRKYFDINEDSTHNSKTHSFLESKITSDVLSTNEFEFNLSLNVGYDDNTILKMNAVTLESQWRNTYVNAVYNCEENEFELGLSNAYLNDYLFKGMKVEFQANPSAGSGAVLLTKTF